MNIKYMKHQAEAIRRAAQHPRYGFWLGCGTGKTIAMLGTIAASKAAATGIAGELADVFPDAQATVRIETTEGPDSVPAPKYYKTVVVCPKAIMRNAWERDAEHFPTLNVVVCWATTPAKRKALIDTPDADILVLNFEMFKKHRRDLYNAGVRRVIVDESSKLKSHETQVTKAMIEWCDHMQSVYLLSGTPAPNNDSEYWSQFRCIDKAVFGDSFYRFASEYFVPLKRTVNGRTVVVGYKEKEEKRALFAKRMRARSWSLRKEDAVDLPEQVDVVRRFELSKDERAAYDDLETQLRTEATGGTLNVKAEALANKLRQVCGGWAYQDAEAVDIGRSKLDTLNDLLDEIGPQPAVIWIDYREDSRRVAALCEKRGEAAAVLDGGTNGNAVKGIVDDFQSGKLKRIICHPASVGHGITLTSASYMVFYSPIWSAELYVQARDRIHRKGQTNRCTYYHLVADDTIERSVLWACRHKKTKSEAMMAMLANKRTQ